MHGGPKETASHTTTGNSKQGSFATAKDLRGSRTHNEEQSLVIIFIIGRTFGSASATPIGLSNTLSDLA
jgi:hypothetical protein